MIGADQNDNVEESADQNEVDFTRFMFYYRTECDEPVKLTSKTFLDVLRRLISAQGRDPNIIEDGDSLLHVAVVENMPEFANYLITVEKVNVNCQNDKGNTPLTKAIVWNRNDLIDILVGANCDVNLPNSNQETPLHLAVDDAKLSMRLIQASADVNAQDHEGNTPLHRTVYAGAVETLCMLLFFNADPNVQRHDGITPFMCAIYAKNHEIQDILIDYVVDFNAWAWDLHESTILSLVLNGDGYLLQDVIDRGVDLDQSVLLDALLKTVYYRELDVFRVIWKYFEPDVTEWSLLEQFQINLQTPRDLIVIMEIILESGNLEPLFVKFDFEDLCRLLIKGDEMKVIAEHFMLTYVAHGYRLDSQIIRMLYYMGGYSKFLEILLYMDIDLKPEPKLNVFSSLLTHIDISMAEFKTEFNHLLIIDSHLPKFFNFVPKKVPSLVELSRDASRDYLVKKFKLVRTKDYYFLVKSLPIGAVNKDILTFKKCIYVQVAADNGEAERYSIQMVNSFSWFKQVFIRNPRSLQ